jgi:carbamate kinase
MRILAALGGNALLRQDEAPTAANQRRNVRAAAEALAAIATGNQLAITHGNGPQVGLLALQGAGPDGDGPTPLDILDAETEGQIGYMIEQELANRLPADRPCAALLTQVEVDANDPAFRDPVKPIGPFYSQAEARDLTRIRGWHFARMEDRFRRVVASPRPHRIVELGVIALLLRHDVVVICAGGGGIPVVAGNGGILVGVEAVIDKDLTSALLARELGADVLLMLTDVDAVHDRWGEPGARRIRRMALEGLRRLSFAPGSMGPKIEAALEFVDATGGIAGIGALADAAAIVAGTAGTRIERDAPTLWWD